MFLWVKLDLYFCVTRRRSYGSAVTESFYSSASRKRVALQFTVQPLEADSLYIRFLGSSGSEMEQWKLRRERVCSKDAAH